MPLTALALLASLPRRALIGLVRGYRLFLSPWLGQSCRFYPTCSAYSIEALQRHGAITGTYLTAARILRCNPYCQGGHDAVPDNPPALFSRLGLTGPAPLLSEPPIQKPPHD